MLNLAKPTVVYIFCIFCFTNGETSYYGVRSWFSPSAVSFGGGGSLLDLSEADIKNPAMLCELDSGRIAFSLVRYPTDINLGHLGWTIPREKMVYSINIRQLDFGDFDGYDEDGNSTGSYSSGDIWLSGTVSSKFRFLSYGISSGLYYSRLSQSESLVLVNTVAGMFHIKNLDMKVAYILKNSGLVLKKYSKKNVSEDIATSQILALSKKLAYLPLELNLDIEFMNNTSTPSLYLSGLFSFSSSIFLRCSLSSDKFDQAIERGITKDLITGTGLGLGFKTKNYSFEIGGYFFNPGNLILGVSMGKYR